MACNNAIDFAFACKIVSTPSQAHVGVEITPAKTRGVYGAPAHKHQPTVEHTVAGAISRARQNVVLSKEH
jgi:hypothetical protein